MQRTSLLIRLTLVWAIAFTLASSTAYAQAPPTPTTPTTPTTETGCTDEKDNDGDGLTDCADSDCDEDSICKARAEADALNARRLSLDLKLSGEFSFDDLSTVSGCTNFPNLGFICPGWLPAPSLKLPRFPPDPAIGSYRTVCTKGCYLLHPLDMRDYYVAAQKTLLIPEILSQRNLALVQRDRAHVDIKALETIRLKQYLQITDLTEEVGNRHSTGTLILGISAGVGVGVLVGVLVYALAPPGN